MLGVERQRRLLQHLRARGTGDVGGLAELLGVSESTVRRDLRELGARGLLTRVHGGASVADGAAPAAGPSALDRRIGRAAAALVDDDSTILVTGGGPATAMLEHLADRTGLTVLTNALDSAYLLGRFPSISVVVPGGVLRHDGLSLRGPLADQVLDEFHVDRAFAGAFGVDPGFGLSAPDVTDAGTDRRLLRRAAQLVVLADASRFGRRGPVRVAGVDRITHLITDDAAPPAALAQLRRRGVHVITC